jgi:hypothetical protein
MNYALETGSGAMIYIPSFIKTDSGIQKFLRGDTHIYIYKDSKVISNPCFYFFKIRKVG